MTSKGQGHDPIIFEAPYLRNCARYMHGHNEPPIGSRPPWVKIVISKYFGLLSNLSSKPLKLV